MCPGILEMWSLNAMWFLHSLLQVQQLLKAHPLSSCFSLCFFLRLKNWFYTVSLGWLAFFPRCLSLLLFLVGAENSSCVRILCLTRHHKPATVIRAAASKKDLFSYPHVNHDKHPKVWVTNFSYPKQNCP